MPSRVERGKSFLTSGPVLEIGKKSQKLFLKKGGKCEMHSMAAFLGARLDRIIVALTFYSHTTTRMMRRH